MAIARPITKTVISTTDWGFPITDEINRLTLLTDRMGGTWRRASGQTVPNITTTTIGFDTEIEDTHGFATPVWTTLTMPAGTAGIYAMSANAWVAGEGGSVAIVVSSLSGMASPSGRANAVDGWCTVSMSLPLTVGVTIQVKVWQNTGSAQNVPCYFTLYRVSA